MNLFDGPFSSLLLLAIYAAAFIALNAVSFFIALFYKKKLKQSSPRWGFVLAVFFAFLFIAGLVGGKAGSPAVHALTRCAAAAAAIASVYSTVSLIVIMQRVRK